MEFLSELLLPGNTSLAATLVLLSFVIAVGIYLGKIRFWGVSLGVTFVLFVGILRCEILHVRPVVAGEYRFAVAACADRCCQ